MICKHCIGTECSYVQMSGKEAVHAFVNTNINLILYNGFLSIGRRNYTIDKY